MRKSFTHILMTSLLLVGCSPETDANKIAEAQACLNKSTAATAMACVSKVSGISSSGASKIRCAAQFIRQGFSEPATLSQALAEMQSGSGYSSTSNAMVVFAFKTEGTVAENSTLAVSTYSECENSGSAGLKLFSSMSVTASVAQEASGAPVADATDMTAALQALSADNTPAGQAKKAIVGESLIDAYNTSCVGVTDTFCTQMAAAIANGNGDPLTVANDFLGNF